MEFRDAKISLGADILELNHMALFLGMGQTRRDVGIERGYFDCFQSLRWPEWSCQ